MANTRLFHGGPSAHLGHPLNLNARAGVIGTLVLFALALAPLQVHATACGGPGFNDAHGECFVNFGDHQGEFPFGVTVIGSENRLAVADLFTGLFFKYSVNDVSAPAQFFFGPLGSGFTTGLAWHPTEDALYWVINDGMGQLLVKSDLQGNLVSSNPLVSPGAGVIGDLTYSAETSSFWAIDYEADLVFEFSATGVMSGNSFPSPGLTSFGGGAYGTGIVAIPPTTLPASSGPRFDIPTGAPVALRASDVIRVNDQGVEQGLRYRLASGNSLTGWVTGVAYVNANVNGHPAEFLVSVTTNRIVEVKVGVQNPIDPGNPEYVPSVINVSCSADQDGNVTLQWTNRIPYASIEVLRNGASIAVLSSGASINPGTVTHMDPMLQSGTYTYQIKVTSNNPNPVANNARCSIVVGVGRLINSAPHLGSNALAITVVESTNRVYVVDLYTGSTHRYDKNLVHIDSINSPFGSATTSGLTWNSSTDSLFWVNADTNRLRQTDLNGVPLAPGVNLNSPAGGALGDISYAPLTNSFWGVDITNQIYFEFLATGALTGSQFPFSTLGLGDAGFGNGIAVVDDASAVVLDVPAGPGSGNHVNQVVRVLSPQNVTSGAPYETDPSTLSGFINGIVWSSSGSDGAVVEYLVGNDTNTIYEVSLTTPGVLFRRGDVNDDAQVNIADITRLLNFIFGINPNIVCLDAGDVNDDGTISIPDVPALLNGIFGIASPPQPFPTCGPDTTSSNLNCLGYTSCP